MPAMTCIGYFEMFNDDSCHLQNGAMCTECKDYLDVRDGACTNNVLLLDSTCGMGCKTCNS